jgi:class 3 adenylate cyclase
MEFGSVVNAAQCAIRMQQGMVLRNADVEPDRRIAFRMGLNLGDVMIDADDLLGDAVNVAARLEALAAVNGLCLSGNPVGGAVGHVQMVAPSPARESGPLSDP